jgi:hypothetical protein
MAYMKSNTVVLYLRVPVEVRDALDTRAWQEDRSMANMASRLLAEALGVSSAAEEIRAPL